MMRQLLQTVTLRFVALLFVVTPAQAQPSAPSSPNTSNKQTDSETAASASASQGLPLRLTLLDPNGISAATSSFWCQESRDEIVHLASLIQLNAVSLPLTRRITLHSFSRWGCPMSAGAGIGLTYAIHLSPKLALVLAGGAAGFPHANQDSWILRPGLRADFQWTTKDGETRSVGVDATQILKSAVKAGVQRKIGFSISGSF